MTSEPSPRQVLYALVSGGFLVVVAILTIGAAVAGLVPQWWSWTLVAVIVASAAWMTRNWRRTRSILVLAIGLFLIWMIGPLIAASR